MSDFLVAICQQFKERKFARLRSHDDARLFARSTKRLWYDELSALSLWTGCHRCNLNLWINNTYERLGHGDRVINFFNRFARQPQLVDSSALVAAEFVGSLVFVKMPKGPGVLQAYIPVWSASDDDDETRFFGIEFQVEQTESTLRLPDLHIQPYPECEGVEPEPIRPDSYVVWVQTRPAGAEKNWPKSDASKKHD